MPLTEERRNQIAWLLFLHHLRNRQKMYSVSETCEYLSREYRIPNNKLLQSAVENAYYEIIFPGRLNLPGGVSERNELVWLLHILFEYKRGIKIGESFNRDIGNKAVEIEVVGIDELRKYYVELITIITSMLSKNLWWQTFNNPNLRLEGLREILAETSKVNTDESGS